VADIPGLIEGAHEGRGLGDMFLGHVERCAVLLHLVDGTAEDVVADYETIIGELEAYGGGLADKPRVTVLNKIDALDDEDDVAERRAALEAASGGPVMTMSGVARTGLIEVLRACARGSTPGARPRATRWKSRSHGGRDRASPRLAERGGWWSRSAPPFWWRRAAMGCAPTGWPRWPPISRGSRRGGRT
jgi:GTPase involved in cell partitioning and DNA repair